MVDRYQSKVEKLWSVGQSIEGVEFTQNGVWLWGEQFVSWIGTDQTRQGHFLTEQDGLVRTLQVQPETNAHTIDFNEQVMREDCAMSAYKDPDQAIIFADRAHFVSPIANQDVVCPIRESLQKALQFKEGYGLGHGVVDLSVHLEGVWVHQNRSLNLFSPKQQESAAKIVDSMVLIGKTHHPLATLDFTESARILDLSRSSTTDDGLWVLIPDHGLLHVKASLGAH
jgi:hypothetical protein